ncbi:MAG: hypothetical protein ACI9XO_000852 [Paraglaciecola sp.]|jgi:hypothetical protein
MKNTKVLIGAFTLISLFIIGMTVQIKASNFIKNWFSEPNPEPTTTAETNTGDSNENVIQLALLLDTSGSMNGLIEQTKSQLWKIVNELSTLKRNGETPPVEIALYEFGSNNYGANNWIRQVASFTRDMDKISEELFSLSTGGSQEYCGLVMQKSLNELQWNNSENSLRMIYIAGNESFAQGPVNYREVVKIAKQRDILINTIFCGPQEQGIALQWQSGAVLAGGEFASIDHNAQTIYVESPYDKEISKLNEELNDTYISYGNEGKTRKENMQRQDANASSYSLANTVERAAFKSSKSYSNEKWDLVDAYKKDKKVLTKSENLPTEFFNLNMDSIVLVIEEKTAERSQINAQIQNLNSQRKQFLTQNTPVTGGANFENSMLQSIQNQAVGKGLVMEEITSMPTYSSALVDYPGFTQMTKEVEDYRKKRMLSVAKFQKMAQERGTIILDTRSKHAYDGKHLKGAIHLNFSDFTADKLAKIIPSKDTRILIYCNNNILGDPMSFAAKSKPLALNIPTFINLYGYGYKDLYELKDLVPVNSEELEFEGTLVKN